MFFRLRAFAWVNYDNLLRELIAIYILISYELDIEIHCIPVVLRID